MLIDRVKYIILIVAITFISTGCNITNQMVIPTPYYPEQSNNLGIEVTDINATLKNNQSDSDTQITPINQDSITVKNRTIVKRVPFPEDEYKNLKKRGSITVKGNIYLRTTSGSIIYGKHTRLYLNPVTSYSTQWYEKSYLGGAKMSKVDTRLFNYLKFTTSNSSGRFEFLNVPSGNYYLIGVVKCGIQCGYTTQKSIRITKKISLFGDNIKNVVLSKVIN